MVPWYINKTRLTMYFQIRRVLFMLNFSEYMHKTGHVVASSHLVLSLNADT